MVSKERQKLTLDRKAAYRIIVPGHLDPHWMEWGSEIKVTAGSDDSGQPLSTLTGVFDQAALLGLLRRLYAMGLPLISVTCLEV